MNIDNFIKGNAKIITPILIVVIVILFLPNILKAIKLSANPNDNQTGAIDASSLNSITYDPNNFVNTTLFLDTLTDTIFNTLNVEIWEPATHWNLIYLSSWNELQDELKQVANKDEAMYIIKKFGTKTATVHAVPGLWTISLNTMTLPEFLAYQLNSDDLVTANSMLYIS